MKRTKKLWLTFFLALLVAALVAVGLTAAAEERLEISHILIRRSSSYGTCTWLDMHSLLVENGLYEDANLRQYENETPNSNIEKHIIIQDGEIVDRWYMYEYGSDLQEEGLPSEIQDHIEDYLVTEPSGTHWYCPELTKEQASTCCTPGFIQQQCAVCEAIERTEKPLDLNNHTNCVTVEKVLPTATTPGREAGVQCADCGQWLSGGEVIAPLADHWGYCGDNINGDGTNLVWTYDSSETLTISGEGSLPFYDSDLDGNYNDPHVTDVPWYPYNMSMKTLVLEEGVTQIYTHNFCGCPNLETVYLPTSLRVVIEVAFYRSSAIKDVYYAGTAAQWNKICFAEIGGPGDTGNDELLNANIHFYGEDWGYCGGEGDGTNLVWVFDSNGTLNISGEGKMANYPSVFDCPWYNLMCEIQIQSIVLNDGVTSVGNNAFYGFVNLTRVTIPDGVERIGFQAFTRCIALTSVSIPGSTTYIEPYAFYDCRSLQNVTIAVGVNKIAQYAFCFNSPAMNVFYAGSENQWKSIKMADVDNELIEANIHYNVVDWGYCGGEGDGTNLIWWIDSNDTLTISGTGAMANYSASEPAPWAEYFAAPNAEITVLLEAGVTQIGANAFPASDGLKELIVLNPDCDLSALVIREPAFLRGYRPSTAEDYGNAHEDESLFMPLCDEDYHHAVVWKVERNDAEDPDGHIQGVFCTVCDDYIYARRFEHDWSDWEITKQPTTEEEGEETRTCSVCEKTETRSVEKLKPAENNNNNDNHDDGLSFISKARNSVANWVKKASAGIVKWFQTLLRFFSKK